ncbi:HEAT repeat-containing protein 6 [Entomortierella lignicola]|nr:HEAT repeat-containing protein 6 [Entomortierella lignicola]
MANASRQRYYKHHRGTPAQRTPDTCDTPRRQLSLKQLKQVPPLGTSDCLPTVPGDFASLRKDLLQILSQVKELESDKTKETAESDSLSQIAQEKLALASHILSPEPEDVGLMSKLVFELFNQDLVKIPANSSPYGNLIENLCRFFINAYDNNELQGNKDLEASSFSSSTHYTNNTSVDAIERKKVDILRALSALLFENGASVKDILEELFQIISVAGKNTGQHDQNELRRMALNCMANMVHKTGTTLASTHERMYEVVLSNLVLTSQYEASTPIGPTSAARRKGRGSGRKLISSALRALHFLLQEDKNIATRSIPPLMSVICRFMFFTSENWTGPSATTVTTNAFNIGVIQRSSYSAPTSSISYSKSTTISSISGTSLQTSDYSESSSASYRGIQSSDSEFSDSESGIHLVQRRQHDGKVRLNALLCLQALARAAPKQLQPHWPKFLTSSSSVPIVGGIHKAPSLIGLIGSDPISNVRSAACVVLGNILESSKQYLAMAEEDTSLSGAKSQTGLFALSERVGLMMRELHVGIALAMDKVDSSMDQGMVVQMIKCCSSIITNCSYEKMRQGLPLLVFHSIEKYLTSDEPNLQSAVLHFLTNLFSNTSARIEARDIILSTSSNVDGAIPELISRILGLVEDPQVPKVVCVEAWDTLRAIAQHHFILISDLWPRLDAALESLQSSEDPRVRTASLMFLEEYSKAGAIHSTPLTSEWWKDALEKHILKAFAEENPSIKALGCDCISSLSSDAFSGLPSRLEMLIMSLVLGTALDEHPVARAAACRAIGVFILFPALREDNTHVVDMASTVLDLCQDPNLNVRVRASWAVGNLCDSLVLLKEGDHSHVLDEILTLPLWTRIMKSALTICQDHEKLKSNGIRAIGGLLRVTFEGILERERHSLVKDAVYALIKHMEQGSLKGRWNACYAMQSVLLNPQFPIGSTAGTSYALESDMVSWTRDVYNALLQAIQKSKNFKVRINACAALTVPKTRAKYGDQAMIRRMIQVLMTAVQYLDEEQGEHEFGEFQYRGQLELKLLRCLDHLLQITGGVASLGLELDPALRQRIVASRPENIGASIPPQEPACT